MGLCDFCLFVFQQSNLKICSYSSLIFRGLTRFLFKSIQYHLLKGKEITLSDYEIGNSAKKCEFFLGFPAE